jgi:hypothetical protein
MPRAKKNKPTLEQFKKYQAAYDYFNRQLFGGELRPCLLVFKDRKAKKGGIVLGHFAPDRWASADGETAHEISLNPDALTRPLWDTMSTLAHEMAHQWQQDHGTPPRAGYHDREWARKMVEIGLIPSNTGQPGGRQTGQQMDHYVDEAGAFKRALDAMPEEIRLPWTSGGAGLGLGPAPKKERPKSKIKYTCPCGVNLWGKPELKVICGECEEPFTELG